MADANAIFFFFGISPDVTGIQSTRFYKWLKIGNMYIYNCVML